MYISIKSKEISSNNVLHHDAGCVVRPLARREPTLTHIEKHQCGRQILKRFGVLGDVSHFAHSFFKSLIGFICIPVTIVSPRYYWRLAKS